MQLREDHGFKLSDFAVVEYIDINEEINEFSGKTIKKLSNIILARKKVHIFMFFKMCTRSKVQPY